MHGNWYFLPGTGHLLMYERTVRQLTGHSDFALPLGLDHGSSAARGFHSANVEWPTHSAVRIAEVNVAN